MALTLLIASPQMTDPFFERTVVLLWHHDEDGAAGVVINRPIPQPLSEVLVPIEGVDLSAQTAGRVGWGGPVESLSATVVTTGTVSEDEGWTLPSGVSVTRSQEALIRLLQERAPILLCLGYAGWGAEQLDREIAEGSWLYGDITPELLDGDPDALYERALATLGLSASMIWMQPIEE